MTHEEIAECVNERLCTPKGTICRMTVEHHNGVQNGEVVEDVRPAALAMIRAAHGRGCACEYCHH